MSLLSKSNGGITTLRSEFVKYWCGEYPIIHQGKRKEGQWQCYQAFTTIDLNSLYVGSAPGSPYGCRSEITGTHYLNTTNRQDSADLNILPLFNVPNAPMTYTYISEDHKPGESIILRNITPKLMEDVRSQWWYKKIKFVPSTDFNWTIILTYSQPSLIVDSCLLKNPRDKQYNDSRIREYIDFIGDIFELRDKDQIQFRLIYNDYPSYIKYKNDFHILP